MAAQTLSLCACALPCEVLVPSFSNERRPDNKLGPTNVVFLSLTSGGRPFYYILQPIFCNKTTVTVPKCTTHPTSIKVSPIMSQIFLQYKVAMCPFSVSIAAIKATVSFTF